MPTEILKSCKDWYYDAPLSESAYTTQPTNNLNVSRLLQGKPAWISPFAGTRRLPKKIILSADAVESSTEKTQLQRIMLFIRFTLLEEAGFEIHYVDKNKHYSISSYILSYSAARCEVVEPFSCAQEEVHIITLQEFNVLFCAHEEDIQSILCAEIKHLKKWSGDISIPTPLLGDLLKHASNLEELNLNRFQLTEDMPEDISLPSLKILNLRYSAISAKGLSVLLRHASNFEALNLDCCRYAEDMPEDISLLSLKILNLRYSTISAQGFGVLLQHASNLEELHLYYCNPIGKLPKDISLPNLKILNLASSTNSAKELGVLLKYSLNLEALNLSRCQLLTEKLPEDIILPNLKTLNLNFSVISAQVFGVLFRHAPNLEELNLDHCYPIGNFPKDIAFPNLKTLYLYSFEISDEALAVLLQHTTNLERLVVDEYRLRIGKMGFELKQKYPQLQIENYIEKPSNALYSVGVQPTKVVHQLPVLALDTNQLLDANTHYDSEKKYQVGQYLFPPDGQDPAVNAYRLYIYNDVSVNREACDIKSAFNLKKSMHDTSCQTVTHIPMRKKADVWYRVKQQYLKKTSVLYGKVPLQAGIWQALPSISPEEVITHYHTDNACQLELRYSIEENLYYVYASRACTFDFIIRRPQPHKAVIPKEIEALIEHYRTFGCSALTGIYQTGTEYHQALESQKIGSCRHRTALFLIAMKEQYPQYPVRIVNNECHSFVEVCIHERWVGLDLGGYPAQLEIHHAQLPDTAVSSMPANVTLYAEGACETEDFSCPMTGAVETENSVSHTVLCVGSDGKLQSAYFGTVATEIAYENRMSYTEDILHGLPKILIECETQASLTDARYAFFQYCQEHSKPFFYIHAPEDLICQSGYVLLDEHYHASLNQAPGGALYRFLEANKAGKPIFIVNYDNFKSSDIVAFNTLLDDTPKADGITLPAWSKVIGIRDKNKPDAYQGADFLSRFDSKRSYPFTEKSNIFPLDTVLENAYLIECYGTSEWEGMLLGRFEMHGEKLLFCPGELVKAIRDGKDRINLKNAPWHNDGFVAFWEKMLLTKTIELFGQTIRLPHHFLWGHTTGYDFEKPEKGPIGPDDFKILNPETLPLFFGEYVCRERKLYKIPGIVETYRGSTLFVHVSHDISKPAWAALLEHCKRYDVVIKMIPTKNKQAKEAVLVFPKDALVIDVTEMSYGDLVHRVDGIWNSSTLSFEFKEEEGVLVNAMKQGKNIILTGDFQDALFLRLMPFVLEQSRNKMHPGEVLICSEKPVVIPGVTSYIDKRIPQHRAKKTLSPNTGDGERLAAVESALQNFPFVFLSGMSGVGKTTFVHQVWGKKYPHMHCGEKHILSWAQDKNSGIKTLFIDEANISSQGWSAFEGLFQNPPFVIIGNKLYRLTKKHKVIFAGNPLIYGGERQFPRLLARHGAEIVFQPLSMDYLKEKVLLPLCQTEALKRCLEPILAVADFLTQASTNDILFTPRELEMMLLLSQQYSQQYPSIYLKTIVMHFVYQLAKPLVPKEKKVSFNKQFKPKRFLWEDEPSPRNIPEMVINHTNYPVYHILKQFLEMRQRRRDDRNFHPHGGLGGLIIEGASGIGKSELVKAVLQSERLFKTHQVHWIPAKISLTEKETLLLQAFHAGEIVVIDEINSAPMMERLLGTLLTGKDLDAHPADRPGFLILGTQNPTKLGGRIPTSSALMHRMHTITMSEYIPKEIIEILEKKGLAHATAEHITTEYLAKKTSCNLCFRDLLRAVDGCLKEHKKAVPNG